MALGLVNPIASRGASLVAKNTALLPIRGALGATMLHHGYYKLKAENREQTGQMFEQLQLSPGKALGIATGIAEVFAGGATILGIFTRPAALAVLVTQAFAINKVHAKNGFDITKGGYEFNVALMAIAAALLISGPGRYSTHEAVEHLAEGSGGRKWLRKTRPNALLRFIKLLK